jgi:hypothetical protein
MSERGTYVEGLTTELGDNVKKFIVAAALTAIAPLIATSTPAEADAAHYAPSFANCTAMHKVFPHGVGLFGAHDHTSGVPVTNFARRPKIYRANTKSDADHDHIACEAH